MTRFRNPALPHRTQQIAMDGSQKLPQRLLGTIRDRIAAGAPVVFILGPLMLTASPDRSAAVPLALADCVESALHVF